MQTITKQIEKDLKVIGRFTEVWCIGHRHLDRQPVSIPGGSVVLQLCPECAEFFAYALQKRQNCPLEAEKPSCKQCRIHCYAAEQRAKVKQIMAWSGRRMILRGRLDYIWHYFF